MVYGGQCPIPLQVSGAVIWLDGSDPDGTGVVPASGTAIGTFKNKTGGVNFTQGTGANQPLYTSNVQAGKGGLVFDGSNDTYSFPTEYYSIFNADSTAFLVLKKDTNNGLTNRAVCFQNAGVVKYTINHGAVTNAVPFHNFTSDTNYLSPSANILNYNIVETRLSSTTQGIRINGGAESTGTGAPTGAIDSAFLFSQGTSVPLPGTLLEYIVYSRSMLTSEATTIRLYLANKWGISS